MSNGNEAVLPQWVNVFIAGISGLVISAGVMVRMVFTLNSRLQAVETAAKHEAVQSVVRVELEEERHNVLYPMLQTRVYAALDKLEEELKMQGQNIAVLLERDRAAAAMERFAETVAKSVGEAVANALKARP